ncbi:MAG: IS30 family transposase [Firmicutes bacterium]|nr:IS30 family transposase [Bacillota bacterium]
MSYVHSTRRRKKGTHLLFEEREELEYLVRRNQTLPKRKRLSQRAMAAYLGVSPSTICRELKRGFVQIRNSQWEEVSDYSAHIGQKRHDERARNKGPGLAIGKNRALAECLEAFILDHYSPYCALELAKKDSSYALTPISLRTLYHYIDQDLFLSITKKDLPRKGKSSKRKYRRVRKRPRVGGAKSILQRPVEAEDRQELGHWEMDCIESGKAGGRAVLLNLTERCTRESLLFKLPSQRGEQVLSVLDGLERKMGAKCFRETFKSITVDNGSEFLDWKAMEKFVINYGRLSKRTSVYYCHPYHSWERGSNEQTNGVIRYFIPKGSDISRYSREAVKQIQDRLNTMPRRIHDGRSAAEERARREKISTP